MVFDLLPAGLSFPSDVSRDGAFNKFIQEFRYVSDLESKLNFSAGVYYADETLDEDGRSESPGLGDFLEIPDNGGAFDDIFRFEDDTNIREFAVFAEFYWDITDKLKGTIGGRFFNATSERSRTVFSSLVSNFELLTGDLPTLSDTDFNPKFGLSYKIDDNNLLYTCLLYTSPSPRDLSTSRMPSSA